MTKLLIWVTNHETLGSTDEKNGTYAPELTHALHVFLEAGYDYDIASVKGGVAPLYGLDVVDGVNEHILGREDFKMRIKNTIPARQIDVSEYDGIFYPGGFGLLSDLAFDQSVAELTASAFESGQAIGAVCHGPAGLLPVELSDGSKLLTGKHVTAFTREEEVDFETIEKIPFLLEEAVTRTAGCYSKVNPWQQHVVTDGRIVTGQNPASARGVGIAMVELLKNS
ncbi:DJ-1/PfpI family protease [Oleiphilus messinensis]|uniref:DJ-1/PfpI family protease n=1 Tax=Oleiphilus messinensis TaxID=141451 RepID=A0A1Y0I9M0_9GAMM|nr:type 1 glutamine amidotransferase domain-containing protein [Oleiphilus messinensis]ARU56124.1 DJ-1/PfpI family protease [Oleiphilus messinensis]